MVPASVVVMPAGVLPAAGTVFCHVDRVIERLAADLVD